MRAAVRHVAEGTYLVHGTNTNWVILTEGDAVTLIDTGYPGDREGLLASLAEVGSAPEAVTAVLITHAHSDHLGSAEYLSSVYGIPVHTHKAEVPHARRDFLHQVTVGQVLRNGWRPGCCPGRRTPCARAGRRTWRSPRPSRSRSPAPARSICPAGPCPCTRPATPPGTARSTSRTPAWWCPATPW
ncbi:hypothetical protein SHKM778_40420 [Streptomyces sp. KM77-8]|uniref:Metallo-beta-lactamase domain-containing protein n=1 Tax=Streptomyces haneummycinicus TaxID=3074435 RepID=A0AAT9HJM2_9ACTN